MSTYNLPLATITKRTTAIHKAMKEVLELQAKRQVIEALQQQNRLDIQDVLDMAIGEMVWVFRENKG